MDQARGSTPRATADDPGRPQSPVLQLVPDVRGVEGGHIAFLVAMTVVGFAITARRLERLLKA